MRTLVAEAPDPDEHHTNDNRRPTFTPAEWARWRRIVGGNAVRHVGASALTNVADAEPIGPVIWDNELAAQYDRIANRRLPGTSVLGGLSLLEYDIAGISTSPDRPLTIHDMPDPVDFDHLREVMSRNNRHM